MITPTIDSSRKRKRRGGGWKKGTEITAAGSPLESPTTFYSLVVNCKLFILDWSICLNMGMENLIYAMEFSSLFFLSHLQFLIPSRMMHWLLWKPICRRKLSQSGNWNTHYRLFSHSTPPPISYPIFRSSLSRHLFHLQQFIVLIFFLSRIPGGFLFSKRLKSLPPSPFFT